MSALLILDKDGTLIRPKSGSKFVSSPEDQEVIPGVTDRLAAALAGGWIPVIASNQGGVAAGHKTLHDAIDEMKFCLSLIPQVKNAWLCPDFEGRELYRATSPTSYIYEGVSADILRSRYPHWGGYRKPQPGMRQRARYLHTKRSFELPESEWIEAMMVGDRPEDEQAAAAANIPFLWAHQWRGESPA